MMRCLLVIAAGSAALLAGAQDLAQTHQLIDEAYRTERYEEVITLIDGQVGKALGTPWEDSLFNYIYPYGRALRMVQGPEQAVAGTERLVNIVERLGNPRHLIEALFDQSWIYYELGRFRDCIRTDSLSMVVADRNPSIPAFIRGRTRQYLAFDYYHLGDYRTMARYAQQALDVYAGAEGIDPIQFSESYNAVGTAMRHLGRIREAEAQYKQALAVLGGDSTVNGMMRRAATNGNLGVIWNDVGDLARSKAYYHENLKTLDWVISNSGDPAIRDEAIVGRSRTYVNLANLSYLSSDLGRTRMLLQMAWDDRSQLLGPDDPQLLSLYGQMADLEMAANDLEKAEKLTIAYLAAVERGLGRQSEPYTEACVKWAEIAFRRGDHGRADSLYHEVLGTHGRTGDHATDVNMQRALRGRAMLNAARKRPEQAHSDLLRARKIAEQINGPTHFRVAELDLLMAEQAFAAGDPQRSLDHAKAVLAMVQDRVEALRKSKVPPQFPAPDILPDAIYWKVRSEKTLHPEALGSARWNDELDLAVRSLMRSQFALNDEDSKILMFSSHQRMFDLALEDAYESYAQSGEEADLQRFFKLSETNRTVLLKSRLNGFAGVSFAGVPDSVLAREQELRKALVIDPDDPQVHRDMDQREREYTALLYRLEQQYPKYFELRYADRTSTLKEVREKLLTDDRQLLVFVRTRERLFAAVIGRERAEIIELQPDSLDEQVRNLNEALAKQNTAAYLDLAQAIYRSVFKPLEPLLHARELLVIPDGELHAVNLEFLLPGPVAGDYRKELLIQRYTIGYLFSATTSLQFADMAPKETKGVFAMAPGFTDQLKRDYLAQVLDSLLVDHRFLRYVRQPFAMNTAQALGRAYKAKVLTGGAASEGAFRKRAADYGVLFLGTHAEMDPVQPMYSRLVFSKDGDGADPEHDGYLHVYEIYELELGAQLAVLTACESGGGQQVAGEGIRSLGAAFAYAGCPSMVVALWNIDEKISAGIIETFYKDLADGLPKHEALRKAKLKYLDHAQDELLHPYYWAGLVLIGDVGPVQFDRPISTLWYVLALVALVGYWAWRKRSRTAHRAA